MMWTIFFVEIEILVNFGVSPIPKNILKFITFVRILKDLIRSLVDRKYTHLIVSFTTKGSNNLNTLVLKIL